VRKNTLNFVVDLLTLIAILAMIGTGLVLYFVLPPGSGGRGLILWELGRHDWGDVHFWTAVSLAALLILHVALHWAWVCGTIRRLVHGPKRNAGRPRSALDNLYGIAFLAILIGAFTAFVFIANANVATSAEEAGRHEAEHADGGAGGGKRAGRGSTNQSAENEHGEHNRSVGGVEIRGSTTLAEIEAATGVSAALIVQDLGLPPDTPTNERVRRLADQYGFSMRELRAAVASHLYDG
jgi:hypothetical protein